MATIRCKECNRFISDGKGEASVYKGYKYSLPWWAWLLPIPIFSGLITRCGARFCCESCRDAHKERHPKAWLVPYIGSHLFIVAFILFGIFYT